MLVKIISGTYGHRPLLPNGKHSPYLNPVKAGSPPIDVDEAEAKRLISLGVAEPVEPRKNTAPVTEAVEKAPEAEAEEETVTEAVEEAPEAEEETVTGNLDGADLEDMSFNDLKALAKDMGIDAGKFKSKAALIKAISEVEVEAPAEDLPDLEAEDVVD
jgi:hypothetical protein